MVKNIFVKEQQLVYHWPTSHLVAGKTELLVTSY